MAADALKLTLYFGERDRTEGGFVADRLVELFAAEEIKTSALFRGVAGFGLKHRIQSAQLLTLSEDLPMVAVAVDARERIEGLLEDVEALMKGGGLITLERARLLDELTTGRDPLEDEGEEVKLTVYIGRRHRLDGRPAHESVIARLRECGVAGATAILGVDGTAQGVRRRARFFGRNADVPVMVISVGDRASIAQALPLIADAVEEPLITLERIRVCKRDGAGLADPHEHAGADPSGLMVWQKLMIYAGEQARSNGRPLHRALVRRLRELDASGVTALRGFWGYHGDHDPHGDRFWSVRRRVPIVTVLVDTPERIAALYPVVDELTAETGLVTSELVPAFRAAGPDLREGGLRLARPHAGGG